MDGVSDMFFEPLIDSSDFATMPGFFLSKGWEPWRATVHIRLLVSTLAPLRLIWHSWLENPTFPQVWCRSILWSSLLMVVAVLALLLSTSLTRSSTVILLLKVVILVVCVCGVHIMQGARNISNMHICYSIYSVAGPPLPLQGILLGVHKSTPPRTSLARRLLPKPPAKRPKRTCRRRPGAGHKPKRRKRRECQEFYTPEI